MKKFIMIFAVILFLSMFGCENNKNNQRYGHDHKNQRLMIAEDVHKQKVNGGFLGDNRKPQYELTSNWSLKPIMEEAEEKVVLLTIDDAPDKYALQMATTLSELNAKAIFFVNGHFLDTDREKKVLKKIYEMGFDIGNHTYSHQTLSTISKEKQKKEVLSLNRLIKDITGEKPKFFRAPHGDNTEYVTNLVKQRGLLLMNWSYGYDWNPEYRDVKSIGDIMVNTNLLGNGSNLLMHDREWTAKALQDIVLGLREKGYKIVDPSLIKVPE